MPQICLYKGSVLIISVLLLIIVETAVIDNCINYTKQQKPEQRACTQCRSGFYLKQNSCSDCKLSSIAEQPQCKNFVVSNYGANYVDSYQTLNQQNQRILTQVKNDPDINQFASIITGNQMFDSSEQNQQKKINQKLFFESILQGIMNQKPPQKVVKPEYATQNKTVNNQSSTSLILIKQRSVQYNATIQNLEPIKAQQKSKLQIQQKTTDLPSSTQQILLEKSDGPLYDLQKIDLKNCKIVETESGKCQQCYFGFEVELDGSCKQKTDLSIKENKNDKNCLIFSQVKNTCLQCDKQMVIDQKGHCVEKTINNKNEGGAIIIKDNLLDAKADKMPALQLTQAKKEKIKTQTPKKSQEGVIFKPKHMDDAISLWSLSSTPLTLTLTLSDENSRTHELKVLTNTNPNNVKPTQISIDVDDTIKKVTVKAEKDPKSESQGCMQWVDKSCVVCKQGYFMNVLVNQCLMIAPYVELAAKSKSNTSKIPTNSFTQTALLLPNINSNSANQSNPQQKQSQNAKIQTNQQHAQVPDMISLKVGNQLINVAIPTDTLNPTALVPPSEVKDKNISNSTSASSQKNTTVVTNPIIQNSTSPANITKIASTTMSTINASNNTNMIVNNINNVEVKNISNSTGSNNTNVKNISNNISQTIQSTNSTITTSQIKKANVTITNQTIANVSLPLSLPPSNTSSNTSSNASSNTSLPAQINKANSSNSTALPVSTKPPQQQKKQIVSITISTTENKVSNIEAKAGAGIIIQKCYKYKENSQQQCLQCDPGFYLYAGKCYDPIKYRALIKSKMILAPSQVGSNSADSLKTGP